MNADRRVIRRNISQEDDGVTAIEFAIVAPVFIMILMAIIELGYYTYVSAVLRGAVEQAARDSALESGVGNANKIDELVTKAVHDVNAGARLDFSRKSYDAFDQVGNAEPFDDLNHNGLRDAGECFTDFNGNGVWDSDTGVTGQGAAAQIVSYTVVARYTPLFPVTRLLGMDGLVTLTLNTQLINQPYALYDKPPPAVVCS